MREYDVVIVGGGIHGAGVLQACAAAGYDALLVEQTGLATGTSSRSSKLIHGGLRYLESAQFALVRESLRERTIMLRLAPELVRLQPFYIPVYAGTRRRPWQLRIGLSLYAALGGFAAGTGFGSVPRSAWDRLDGLDTQGLQAVIRYHDGQTDDALLTRSVVQSAQALGAQVALPARFLGAELGAGGVELEYEADGARSACRARVLVNAAGPWAPGVARLVRPAIAVPPVELVQGTHIVVPVPVTAGIYYVESPLDGRAVFIMPWHGATMIGTTETPYAGDPAAVAPLAGEEQYLIDVARRYMTTCRNLTRNDITMRFAGLRVLPRAEGAAFNRSRETMYATDRDLRPRVLGIFGGKLTGWRAAAGQVLERIRPSLPARVRRARTDEIELRYPQ